MTAANVHDISYLNDLKWEYHDCLIIGDKGYLRASVRQNLFDYANITLDVPYRLNQKDWVPPSDGYRRFRKRIETGFSQLDESDCGVLHAGCRKDCRLHDDAVFQFPKRQAYRQGQVCQFLIYPTGGGCLAVSPFQNSFNQPPDAGGWT